MASRRDIVHEMATMLWAVTSQWQGNRAPTPPAAALRAADELGRLYEAANQQTLPAIAQIILHAGDHGVDRAGDDHEIVGAMLADLALGSPATAALYADQESFQARLARTRPRLVVPTFTMTLEGDVLEWEGSEDPRPTWETNLADSTPNPARRMPTVHEVAQAFSYIEREFKPDRRGISGERWAEGLAFGEYASVDKSHDLQAQHIFSQFDTATWLEIAAHADELRAREGESPRFSGTSRGRVNPPRKAARARYADDPDDAEIDRAAEHLATSWMRETEMAPKIRVTPRIDARLREAWQAAPSMMSEEAAARVRWKIDRALRTGELDQYTADLWLEPEDLVSNPCTANPSKTHVLVLEDDHLVQKAVVRWIKKLFGAGNVEVLVADNVADAIAHLSAHDIKLIVSDVDVVGDQNGVDLFRYVQAHHPDLVDRYIFFTGGHPEVAQIHYRYLPKGDSTFEDFKAMYRAPAPGARAARPSGAPSTVRPLALAEFAAAVQDAIAQIREEPGPSGPRGRFGAEKVYIAAIWRALAADPRFAGMTLAQFKARLVEANREQLLDLVRADSQGDMDPKELADSEISDMGATFHFVIDRNALRRRNPATFDLKRFAGDVGAELPYIVAERTAAGRARGRYGDRKVFIAALWRQLSTHPRYRDMTFDEFKGHLLDAVPAKLLQLARADLVAAMDDDEVRQSETVRPGTTFPTYHVVIDE